MLSFVSKCPKNFLKKINLLKVVIVMSIMIASTTKSFAETQNTDVVKPITAFFDALSRRDKAGMMAQVAPNVEIMSLRNGEIRRMNIDQISDLIVNYKGKDIVESIHELAIHVDENVAVIWAPYKFTIDSKVDHCGTNIFSLLKINGSWIIVGIADNSRSECD